MKPILDCYIWSVSRYSIENFHLVELVYYYNSLEGNEVVETSPDCTQIPEFEIKDIHLLEGVDFDYINKNNIPIIKVNEDNSWQIDLKYYDKKNNFV